MRRLLGRRWRWVQVVPRTPAEPATLRALRRDQTWTDYVHPDGAATWCVDDRLITVAAGQIRTVLVDADASINRWEPF